MTVRVCDMSRGLVTYTKLASFTQLLLEVRADHSQPDFYLYWAAHFLGLSINVAHACFFHPAVIVIVTDTLVVVTAHISHASNHESPYKCISLWSGY